MTINKSNYLILGVCLSVTALSMIVTLTAACQTQSQPETPQVAQAEKKSPDPAATLLSLERAIDYLMNQQSDDGLWRSPNYGNLKQGAAITAAVVYALGEASDRLDEGQRQRLQKAVDTLLPAIREQGYVSNPDGPDYSNYGSAMLLVAGQNAGLKLPDDVVKQLVAYLVRSQLDEGEGFDDSSRDYGGWDLTGWMTGQRPTTGTNISVSASVMEALQKYPDEPGVARAMKLASKWLAGCQNRNGDGGFHFHPRRDHDGNKAGWMDELRTAPNSYGSTTADGIRAMRFIDVPPDSEPFVQAVSWLSRNDRLDIVPGFEDDPNGRSWQSGLRYYYYCSLSDLYGWQLDARQASRFSDEVSLILRQEQRIDGSWSNPVARMREDDPLIATSFAVITLARILKKRAP